MKLPRGIFVLSKGYAMVLDNEEETFIQTGKETLAFLFVKLNYNFWKNWSGIPSFGSYIKEFKYKTF